MSGNIPLVSGRQAVNALQRLGFAEAHTKGDYMTMHRPREGGGTDVLVIVLSRREVPRNLLRSSLRQGKVSVAEFREALR